MNKTCNVCHSESGEDIEINSLKARRCLACGLVWLIEQMDTGIYYKSQGHSLGKGKALARRTNVRSRIKLIKGFVPLDNVCDIGAGDGTFLEELRELGHIGLSGIEPNSGNARFARGKGLDEREGLIEDIGALFPENGFRTFTLFHVIEHLPDPRRSMELLARYMEGGSYLVVETPNMDAYAIKNSGYRHPLINPEHLFYFNPSNMRLLFESLGLEVIAEGKRDFIGGETFFKRVIRPIRSILVRLSGRADFMWFILKKHD